jgi:hypothetical protein
MPKYTFAFGSVLGWIDPRERGLIEEKPHRALSLSKGGSTHLFVYNGKELVMSKDMSGELWAWASEMSNKECDEPIADIAAHRVIHDSPFKERMDLQEKFNKMILKMVEKQKCL